MFKLTDRVENLGQTWMKESFLLGAALILLFFILLLLYRVVSQRLVDSRKGQTLTALLLVAGAACISGYLAFSGGTSSQAVVPASDPDETEEPRNAVYRTVDPAKGNDLPTRMIQAEIPTDPILTPSPPSTSTSSSPSVPAQGVKEEKALPENAVRVHTLAQQPPTPAYSIQLGSFCNPRRAEERVHLLSSFGLKAFRRRVVLPDKGVFHRVLVGTFATRGQARAVQDRLLEQHHLTESLIVSCLKD